MKYSSSDGKPPVRPQGRFPTSNSGRRRVRLPFAWLAVLGFWLAAPPVPALDSDSKQPMYIEADTATYDEKKGETVYIGSVKATQGSLEVLGDKMTVYQKDGKTDKIVILGKPAKLKQTPEGGKEDMHGLGQRADYFPETGILILYDKAITWEGPEIATSEHVVRSDRIEYDTRNSLFKAGNASSGNKRVHVTIQPKEEAAPR
jgi:lipopolysaccharide export system protein LptA